MYMFQIGLSELMMMVVMMMLMLRAIERGRRRAADRELAEWRWRVARASSQLMCAQDSLVRRQEEPRVDFPENGFWGLSGFVS